jgi:arsenate reductase-like glutaredoxin family protein
MQEKEALELVKNVEEIFASKGTKVIHIDLRKEKPDPAALTGLLLGPTGNLRAPTLVKGKTLIVGFDQETYQRVFGKR